MGYYTDYTMLPDLVSPDLAILYMEETHQAIQEFVEATKVDGWSYLDDIRRGEGYGLTWYDHQKDMVKLSAAFPNVLFTLCGHGDEEDDQWQEYYLYGKCQIARGKVVYAAFDEEKLKDINFNICPACLGAGVLDADGFSTVGCSRCWGTGETH